MFGNEYEKMQWIATERRARLLQEARIDRLIGQPAQSKLFSALATTFKNWLSLSEAIRWVALRRPLADA